MKPDEETLKRLHGMLRTENSRPGEDNKRLLAFIGNLRVFASDLSSILYGVSQEGTPSLRKKIEVKYGWLRTYAKTDFYEFQAHAVMDAWGKLPKKYRIAGLRENFRV